MNRTIKFRAWDSNLELMMPEVDLSQALQHYKWLGRADLPLMQYTGLKDKNGKEIWEGDLMLTDDMYHDYEDGVAINALPDGKIYPVEHRDGAFFAGDELLYEVATANEVIGNLYENEDLLSSLNTNLKDI